MKRPFFVGERSLFLYETCGLFWDRVVSDGRVAPCLFAFNGYEKSSPEGFLYLTFAMFLIIPPKIKK